MMLEPTRDYNRYPQQLGKKMIFLAWVVLLAFLSWIFSLYLERQRNPNTLVQGYSSGTPQEVVLERNRYGHYIADGQINGRPVTFILDTGATMVDVPGRLAIRLSLPQGLSLTASTANGDITVYSTILDEVQLGGIRLTGVQASINPSMQEDEILLGMSFLKRLDFSQQGDRLTLRQHIAPATADK